MNEHTRQFVEGQIRQGIDETVTYQLETSTWSGTTRSSPAVTVYEYGPPDKYTDVSSTVSSGVPIVAGTVITFTLTAIGLNKTYRVEVKWTNENSEIFEAWGELQGER